MSRKQPLPLEHDEIRLRGLRILARMIARAHLDSLAGEPVSKGDAGTPAGGNADREDPPRRDGEYVG